MKPRKLFTLIWLTPAALWVICAALIAVLKLLSTDCIIHEGFVKGCSIGSIELNGIVGWTALYSTFGLILFVVPWTVILRLAKGFVKLVLAEINHRKRK